MTPEALHEIIERGFNEGDLDLIVDAYDGDAILVVPPDGHVARGHHDIRFASAAILARNPRMTIAVVKKLEGNGLAVTQGRWQMQLSAPDGQRHTMAGHGTLVSRKRPDGSWGIVLDDPLSETT